MLGWIADAFTLVSVSWAVISERLREAGWLDALRIAERPLVTRGSDEIRAEKARSQELARARSGT